MRAFRAKGAASIVVLATAALLAGCAKRDSITVGAVPDDYRTNHPIVLSQGEETLDVPVGILSYRMTPQQKVALDGFMDDYGESGRSVVTIMVPKGSSNAPAAARVSEDMSAFLARRGVPEGYLQILPYRAGAEEIAPIRITYSRLKASVPPCGRWPADLLENYENRHWANFGCSYQNNLAAQVANPMDFLGPRKQTPIDPDNRVGVLEKYKGISDSQYEPGQFSADFKDNSEVNY